MKKGSEGWPTSDTTVYTRSAYTGPDGTAVFESLFPGDYCFYAEGYDVAVASDVIGYGQVSLNTSTVENNEYYLMLNVTE